jgi:RNA polymerase sigma-70 factor (ECF subfamily)
VAARPELRLVKPTDSLAPEPIVPAETVTRTTTRELERALSLIGDEQREAVLLADLWGFTYAEIAEIAEVAVGTVRSRISRGRLAIMRTLVGEGVVASSERKP